MHRLPSQLQEDTRPHVGAIALPAPIIIGASYSVREKEVNIALIVKSAGNIVKLHPFLRNGPRIMKTLSDEKCQQDLTRRVRSLQPDSQRRWGKMSARQMVCHLADGFRMYMGLRPVADASTSILRSAVKWVALWAPLPWPHGFRTVPELDQEGAGTEPTEFNRDVDELLRL